MIYEDFLKEKEKKIVNSGFDVSIYSLNQKLFKWQALIVKWALKKGRAALFEDCGLGKTIQQLEWSRKIIDREKEPIMIFAPLAVANQTKIQGDLFGYTVNICKTENDVKDGINISNYERIEKFNFDNFIGIVLDESSIIKSFSGKIRNIINEKVRNTQYRLFCSATPSPNDHVELGNHSELLGYMTRSEMLSKFFVHDGGSTQSWRLRGWAQNKFWEWLCSWSIILRNPADIGFPDKKYNLPKLNIYEHIVKHEKNQKNELFVKMASGLIERKNARKESIEERTNKAAEIVNKNGDIYIAWCNLNEESKRSSNKINGAKEITGSDKEDYKTNTMIDFTKNKIKCLVTKPRIAGFGLNLQNCSNMLFIGLSDSFEWYYQSLRRCWRYGQENEVNAHIIISEKEGSVLNNIKNKARKFRDMIDNMAEYTKKTIHDQLLSKDNDNEFYETSKEQGKNWTMLYGDCVEQSKNIKDKSIDFIVYSPPFSNLYTYSDSIRDMGNCNSDEEFKKHYVFQIKENMRILKEGRLCSVHCMNIPAMKERDGYIGIKDFRGDIIRLHEKEGFILHSEVVIWKDPLVEATRTKAIGLMHKQLQKDSSICRCGLPDYVLTFRSLGTNKNLISHDEPLEYCGSNYSKLVNMAENDPDVKNGNWSLQQKLSHYIWREYASPVWMDIRQTNTLTSKEARDPKDDKHICPLQLDTIGRLIALYSNQGDLIFSPFAGIGSEGYQSLIMKRKFIGIELKKSYFDVAVKNLNSIENKKKQLALF